MKPFFLTILNTPSHLRLTIHTVLISFLVYNQLISVLNVTFAAGFFLVSKRASNNMLSAKCAETVYKIAYPFPCISSLTKIFAEVASNTATKS